MLLTRAAIFVVALFWSAVLDLTIRLLHVLQSLIYVAVVVLARRNSPWGSPRPPRELPPLRGVGPRFHLRRVRFLGIRCRHTLRPQMDLCGWRRLVRRVRRLLRCHRRQRRARHRLTPAQFATHQSRCRRLDPAELLPGQPALDNPRKGDPQLLFMLLLGLLPRDPQPGRERSVRPPPLRAHRIRPQALELDAPQNACDQAIEDCCEC